MDDPYLRSRGKRSYPYHDRDYSESNGKHKRFIPEDALSGPALSMPKMAPGDTVFRLLCPEPKIGSVIGKGGSIVKALRHETGAKITIADSVEGAEERVIFITSSERDRERSRGSTDRGRRDWEREKRDNSTTLSPAQEALIKVHERIIEGGTLNGTEIIEEDPTRLITTRLLVPNSQVGCLLGKGGKIIERMREESKTQMRILPRDQAPFCAMSSDEIVQIVGDIEAVKKALRLVSIQLFENPPRERALGGRSPEWGAFPLEDMNTPYQPSFGGLPGGYESGQHQKHLPLSYSDHGIGLMNPAGSLHGPGNVMPEFGWQASGVNEELVFRILCPNEKIGGIIGRGGSIIQNLQEEIGVRIKVSEPLEGSQERIVAISAIENPDDNISPAQEALLHVQSKIADLGQDEDAVITSRLLVPANQVGCLLGKGGSIIAEMRRLTRANIRILGKDDLPKCASSNDELVQIVGDIRNAREALIQVTKRLRSNLYYERSLSSSNDNMALNSSVHQRRYDHVSPARIDFHSSTVHNNIRLTSSNYHASPPSPYWSGQDPLGRNLGDYGSPVNKGSELFRSRGALVTKTTVEVVIPHRIVAFLLGDGGSKLTQIRQISGAKVNILDVRSGVAETTVEISGTPEQTDRAQNLLQGIILQTPSLSYAV